MKHTYLARLLTSRHWAGSENPGGVVSHGKPGIHKCFPLAVARCCRGHCGRPHLTYPWRHSQRVKILRTRSMRKRRGSLRTRSAKGEAGGGRLGCSFICTMKIAAERKAKLENSSISYLLIYLIAIPSVSMWWLYIMHLHTKEPRRGHLRPCLFRVRSTAQVAALITLKGKLVGGGTASKLLRIRPLSAHGRWLAPTGLQHV